MKMLLHILLHVLLLPFYILLFAVSIVWAVIASFLFVVKVSFLVLVPLTFVVCCAYSLCSETDVAVGTNAASNLVFDAKDYVDSFAGSTIALALPVLILIPLFVPQTTLGYRLRSQMHVPNKYEEVNNARKLNQTLDAIERRLKMQKY